MPSILVLGAGELGTAILSALATHPCFQSNPHHHRLAVLRRAVTLASEDPATQAELARLSAMGIAFETGDLAASPLDELSAVFARYDVVIQAAGYGAPRGTLLRVAEAAVAAGVKKFLPWQFGVDYQAIADDGGGVEGSGHAELFGEMLAVRELLRGQRGTTWTVVSTGLFMSFLFLRAFGVVDFEERGVRALGGWGNRVTVTEVKGIGKMVAEVVFEPGLEGETENRVVYVAGDTVSYGEVADILRDVYGGQWGSEVWGREELRKRLEKEPGNVMLKYQNVFGAGVGVSWEMERTLNYQRGIKLIGLKEYVEGNKERLASTN
ncbi:hypothetical protein VTI74DRAFT_9210 [Chaetomium olivicolor]